MLIPGLNFTNVADVTTTTPGSVVRYTVTASNTGEANLEGVAITLNVDGVVDEASYNYDATTSTGSLQPQADGTVFWVLDLAPGESATGILSFTVNDSDHLGDHELHNIVTSDAPGSECPTGPVTPNCESVVPVLVPGLTILKSADATSVTPGDTIEYTILLVNDGETSYPAASFSDSLDGVLTDATYNGDAEASSGDVSYDASVLSWTGELETDESATITYSVTVLDPDPGDKRLTNTVQSTAANNNCVVGSPDPRCSATVDVLVPGLTFTKTADRATTVPGGRVGYTIGVRNTGATPFSGAALTDVLDNVLDDADYNSDAAASSGVVSSTSNTVKWTGDLAVDAATTITYSVTVQTADLGDDLLTNGVTSTSRGSNCGGASADPRCTTTVAVARLTLSTSYTEVTTTPGAQVHALSSYRNTGQVPYVDIRVDFGGEDIVDDAASNGDQAVSSGSFVLTATEFYWQGSIAPGEVVTGGGTLTVLNPDPGNQVITGTIFSSAPGSNCTSSFVAAGCRARSEVLTPDLTISKTANTTTVEPGGVVAYTVTVINTGQTPYVGARLTDSLSGLLDDAAYNANAVATSGTLGYVSPVLSWTGDLSVGQQVTITYSATARSPDPGDKAMVNTVFSEEVGSNCLAARTDASCRSSVDVLTPALTIVKTADLDNTTLGSTVTYTVVVSNSGQTSYPSAAFTDPLAGVLDDATYNAGAHLGHPGNDELRRRGTGLVGSADGRPVGQDHLHGQRQEPVHRQPQPEQHDRVGRGREQLRGDQQRPTMYGSRRRHQLDGPDLHQDLRCRDDRRQR